MQIDNITVMLQPLPVLLDQCNYYGREIANRQHKTAIGNVYERKLPITIIITSISI